MRKILFAACLVFSISGISLALADDATLYVQSVKAELKQEPKMSAQGAGQLKRGDKLTVLKKDGLWFQVKAASGTGWVSKLFVNSTPPVGEAQLAKELEGDENLAKSARRRSSSYTASATTRGLLSGNRVRDGREKYEADPEAVQKMDSYKVPENELRKFQEMGKLGQ